MNEKLYNTTSIVKDKTYTHSNQGFVNYIKHILQIYSDASFICPMLNDCIYYMALMISLVISFLTFLFIVMCYA